jgi:hypothetical protein
MYGTKPLRLIYDEDDLRVDYHSFDWDGQYYPPGLNWESNISGLLRLLGREAFEYVNDIEIFLDVPNSENAQRTILLDFVDALRTKRRTPLRRLTMKLTGEEEELGVSHFLQAFREVPEFKDIRFEIERPHWYGREDGGQLLQREQLLRAYDIRDSLLLRLNPRLEQFQE